MRLIDADMIKQSVINEMLSAGFSGNIDAFLARVSETHGDNKHALVYRAAAEAAKVHIDLEEDGNSQQ